MNLELKKISAVMLVLLLFFTSAAFANAVWISGKVTQEPHEINDSYYIQVDGDLYRILPDIPIFYRYERSPGAFNDEKTDLYSIGKNQEIMMKVRKNQVTQIIIY